MDDEGILFLEIFNYHFSRKKRLALKEKDLHLLIKLGYLAILDRFPEPAAIDFFKDRLSKDMSLADFKNALLDSDEARNLRSSQIQVLGDQHLLNKESWDKRAKFLGVDRRSPKQSDSGLSFKHSGQYEVSAVASIFRAGKFIELFLQNITSQSFFDRSELIIIDANSPDGEEEIISRYTKKFPNIIYRRLDYRAGIYDAWNMAVKLSRGKFLTNVNVDDSRRQDSFELQAKALDASGADVVYQNFFYSLDYELDFESVANIGFSTNLPEVAIENLIQFNSPHHAPMWRKQLHCDLGLFDTSFESAGDWEFWLRCLSRGKSFHLIKEPHAVYYYNPEGISTREDSRSSEEARWIMSRYKHLLWDSLL